MKKRNSNPDLEQDDSIGNKLQKLEKVVEGLLPLAQVPSYFQTELGQKVHTAFVLARDERYEDFKTFIAHHKLPIGVLADNTTGPRTIPSLLGLEGCGNAIRMLCLLADQSKDEGLDSLINQAVLGAANGNHPELVKSLLQDGIEIDGKIIRAAINHAVIGAANGNHPELVRSLLQDGIEIDGKIIRAAINQAVIGAAKDNHSELVRSLLQDGIEIDGKIIRADINHAVYGAARGNHPELVRSLLQEGIEIDGKIIRGDINQAVLGAANGNHPELVRSLLQEGIEIDGKIIRADINTAVLGAAKCNHPELVRSLLQEGIEIDGKIIRADINQAVRAAAKGNHFELVRSLLQDGIEIGGKIIRADINHALREAAECNHPELIRSLLKEGIEIGGKIIRADINTAVLEAAKCNHLELVRSLLQEGIEIDGKIIRGAINQAVLGAAKGNHPELVWSLLKDGIEIGGKIIRTDISTAVLGAANGNHPELVRSLLQDGIEIDGKIIRADINTAVLGAAGGNHFELVRSLLQDGIEIDGKIIRADINTAVRGAARGNHFELVRSLLQEGAEIDGEIIKPDLKEVVKQTPIAALESVVSMLVKSMKQDENSIVLDIDRFKEDFKEKKASEGIDVAKKERFLNLLYGSEPDAGNKSKIFQEQAITLCDAMQGAGVENFSALRKKFPVDLEVNPTLILMKELMENIYFMMHHHPSHSFDDLKTQYKDRTFLCAAGANANLQMILSNLVLGEMGMESFVATIKRELVEQFARETLPLDQSTVHGGEEIHDIASLVNVVADEYQLLVKTKGEDPYVRVVEPRLAASFRIGLHQTLQQLGTVESLLEMMASQLVGRLPEYSEERYPKKQPNGRCNNSYAEAVDATLAEFNLPLGSKLFIARHNTYENGLKPHTLELMKHSLIIKLHDIGLLKARDVEYSKFLIYEIESDMGELDESHMLVSTDVCDCDTWRKIVDSQYRTKLYEHLLAYNITLSDSIRKEAITNTSEEKERASFLCRYAIIHQDKELLEKLLTPPLVENISKEGSYGLGKLFDWVCENNYVAVIEKFLTSPIIDMIPIQTLHNSNPGIDQIFSSACSKKQTAVVKAFFNSPSFFTDKMLHTVLPIMLPADNPHWDLIEMFLDSPYIDQLSKGEGVLERIFNIAVREQRPEIVIKLLSPSLAEMIRPRIILKALDSQFDICLDDEAKNLIKQKLFDRLINITKLISYGPNGDIAHNDLKDGLYYDAEKKLFLLLEPSFPDETMPLADLIPEESARDTFVDYIQHRHNPLPSNRMEMPHIQGQHHIGRERN